MVKKAGTLKPVRNAVLLLVFNRPGNTRRVLEAIRQARPGKLYVASDGPRASNLNDESTVSEVRELVTRVNWECELHTLFRTGNLGCKRAVSSAIDWFFEHEQQGLILEDDCLPHQDFFRFCDNLLEKYKYDDRISVITGNNFQNGRSRGSASYYFSKYNHCWGWATWRRSWKFYRGDIGFWQNWKTSHDWHRLVPDSVERRYWERIFERVQKCEIDSWAYPWTASVWHHGGLTATPNVNLVSNIGFGPESTHTASPDSPYSAMQTTEIGEIIHPIIVAQDHCADRFVFETVFGGQFLRYPRALLTIPHRAYAFLKRILVRLCCN